MIEQTTFLGFQMGSLRNRRVVVIGYYILLAVMGGLTIAYPRLLPMAFVGITVAFAGLLGGNRAGGFVKSFTEPKPPRPDSPYLDGSGIQQLNLSNRPRPSLFSLLDERDRTERDHAHFVAFRIVRMVLSLVAFLFWIANDINPHTAFNAAAPATLWMLLIVVSTLPQAVILWTEPEPTPEMVLAD